MFTNSCPSPQRYTDALDANLKFVTMPSRGPWEPIFWWRHNRAHHQQRGIILFFQDKIGCLRKRQITMSKLLHSILLFAVFLSARALVCPSTCPLVVTANGNSNCCSIGDGADGCGVCGFSSCYYNNFASCVEAFGTQCSLDTANCVVKSVGGWFTNTSPFEP